MRTHIKAVSLILFTGFLFHFNVFPQITTESSETKTINEKGETVTTTTTEGSYRKELFKGKKSADQYVSEVEKYFYGDDYDNAVILGSECVNKYSKEAKCYYLRGRARAENGLIEDARQDFDYFFELKKYDDKFVSSLKLTAISLYTEGILGQGEKGERKVKYAIEIFNLLLKIKPDGEFFMWRGDLYKRMGKPDLAIADYDKSLSLNPKLTRVYESRRGVYCSQGKETLAAADEAKLLELGAQNIEPCSQMEEKSKSGDAAFGNFSENDGASDSMSAKTTETKTDAPNLAENNKSASDYNNEGENYMNSGNYLNAVSTFTKAIKLDSKSDSAYRKRADSYVRLCLFNDALKDYAEGEKINPDSYEFGFGRAIVYLYLGDADKALAEYDLGEAAFKRRQEKQKGNFYVDGRYASFAGLQKNISDLKSKKAVFQLPCQQIKNDQTPFLKKNRDSFSDEKPE